MLCNMYKIISRTDGKKNILASVIAEEKPDTFPVNGQGIENLDETFVFVPGSKIMVLSEMSEYILGPDTGEWYKWRTSGGGGGGGDGGTKNYNLLDNKPKINNKELKGNVSLEDIGIEEMTAEELAALWDD